MDTFRRIIESNYDGFRTDDAISIIKDSAEVTRYVEKNRAHLEYVSQLMNDKIIDEAMGRVRNRGEFSYDGDGGFTYKPTPNQHRSVTPNYQRNNYQQNQVQTPNYNYSQYNQNYVNNDNVSARLALMEQEMQNLRRENDALKNKIERLR